MRMDNKLSQIDKSMSREDLKCILFDWLKEKGILEELQVFLRAKMVEKLQGTCLRSVKKSADLKAKDHAMNMIVCNYLKQSQMHYTLSVFASECPSLQSLNSLNDNLIKENVYSMLKIENLKGKVGDLVYGNNKCILQELVDVCSIMCTKKFQNMHSQHSGNQEMSKLLINTHSQTETQKVSLTKAAQTKLTNNVATQTESKDNSENRANVEAITKLRSQLEVSQTALKLCQLELQDSRRTIENLVNNRLKFSNQNTPHLVSEPAHEFSTKTSIITSNQGSVDQKIQESRQFLDNLDNQLEHLDEKYFSLTKRNDKNKHQIK